MATLCVIIYLLGDHDNSFNKKTSKRGDAKPLFVRATKAKVLYSKTFTFRFFDLNNITQTDVKNIFTLVIFLYKMTIMEDIKNKFKI